MAIHLLQRQRRAVIVADCGNHRLWVVSADGEWRVLTLHPQPIHPMAAVLHGHRLYVAGEDHIYVYT